MSKPKVLNTNGIGALLKVEISKNARGCVAQHISKPKWLKHLSVGALLEVEMSKKCASKHVRKSNVLQRDRER